MLSQSEEFPYFVDLGTRTAYYLGCGLPDNLFLDDDYWWDVYNNLREIGRDGS